MDGKSMLKKIMFCILVCVSQNSWAILLRSGAEVPRAIADLVWNSIENLYDSGRSDILCDLLNACLRYNRQLDPENFVLMGDPERINNKNITRHFKSRLSVAVSYGLCDKNGAITEHISQVITCAVSATFKTPRTPISVHIQNPISWKNYLNIRYYLKED